LRREKDEIRDEDIFNEDNELNKMRVSGRDILDPYREREDDEEDWENAVSVEAVDQIANHDSGPEEEVRSLRVSINTSINNQIRPEGSDSESNYRSSTDIIEHFSNSDDSGDFDDSIDPNLDPLEEADDVYIP